MSGGIRDVGVSGMYWGWQGLQVFRGQKGYKALEALGLLRGVGAVLRVSGGIRSVRGVLGAGRDSRYSGARRGIKHWRHWGS